MAGFRLRRQLEITFVGDRGLFTTRFWVGLQQLVLQVECVPFLCQSRRSQHAETEKKKNDSGTSTRHTVSLCNANLDSRILAEIPFPIITSGTLAREARAPQSLDIEVAVEAAGATGAFKIGLRAIPNT